jgi:two-component system NtrC family response regulator
MKDNVQDPKVNLAYQLEEIEKLIEKNGYVEALAQIREVQSSGALDSFTLETGEFYYHSAKVFRYLGSYNEAIEAGQRAISIFIDLHDELKIAQTQYLSGLIYIAIGDLKLAEIEVRDAFTGFKRCNDYKGIIDCLSRLSQVEFIRGNYTKSIEYLQDALGYSYKAEDFKKKAIIYGNLGQRFLMIGNWNEAERNLLLNTGLNRQAKDELNLCRGLLSLGYIYFLKREFTKAQETYEESSSLIQKNNCVRELTIYHEFSGELVFIKGDYQSAENHYKKVFEIMEERASEGDMISQTYRLLADLQVAKKEYDLALNSCDKALKVSISLGERLEEAACYRILGQIYTVKGEKEKARENFEKSLNIFEEIKAKYELAKTYLETGKSNCFEYFERLKYLGKAEDIFEELESKYHLAWVNFALSHLFFENQEYEKSDIFLKDAEKVFKELKEDKDLELVQEFGRKLEKFSGEIEVADPEKRYSFSQIITQNKEMLDILEKAKQIKDTDMTILIEGETGTGKDLLAKCIHYESKRKDKRFVSVSCAAIPEALLESELFGHKKGAFTSAGYDKKGLLEEADGGTLFLNEVADLPLSIQAKLLGVIENKELTRLGETTPRKVNFRIIAASNKNLEDEVKSRRFRDDLYYRLNLLKFILPPLRERKEDLPLLIEHFLINSDIQNNFRDFDFKPYLEYHWPGNVRELENEITRSSTFSGDLKFSKNLEFLKDDTNFKMSFYDKIAEFEKEQIIEALRICNNIKSKAAKMLNIPEATLHRKIKMYDIKL